jgi:hypothetical protein
VGVSQQPALIAGCHNAPNSGQPISRILSGIGAPKGPAGTVISLGRASRRASCSLPGTGPLEEGGDEQPPAHQASLVPAWPCSWWGLPGRAHCWARRWSLKPPFHPYRRLRKNRSRSGGLFLWPDPAGYPAPGITRHHALGSADFPRRRVRRRDRPANLSIRFCPPRGRAAGNPMIPGKRPTVNKYYVRN